MKKKPPYSEWPESWKIKHRAHVRAWRTRNREAHLAYQHEYDRTTRYASPERRQARRRAQHAYYQRTRLERLAYARDYKRLHPFLARNADRHWKEDQGYPHYSQGHRKRNLKQFRAQDDAT